MTSIGGCVKGTRKFNINLFAISGAKKAVLDQKVVHHRTRNDLVNKSLLVNNRYGKVKTQDTSYSSKTKFVSGLLGGVLDPLAHVTVHPTHRLCKQSKTRQFFLVEFSHIPPHIRNAGVKRVNSCPNFKNYYRNFLLCGLSIFRAKTDPFDPYF